MNSDIINKYGELNSIFNQYKADVEKLKTAIKTDMLESNVDKATSDKYTVSCKIIDKSKFDDDKLVAKLKEIWSCNGSMENPYLKRIYVPDMDAIENALYSGELDAKDLASCKIKKSEVRLTIKENKHA